MSFYNLYFSDSGGRMFYLGDKNIKYGYLDYAWDVNKREASIVSVFVEEPYRKQGVASKLMNHILDYFKENQIKTVYVTPDKAEFLKKFYQKFGFESFDPDPKYKELRLKIQQ